MTLKRINRVQIGKIAAVAGQTAWDLSERYAAGDMVGAAYTDLRDYQRHDDGVYA